jgi:hypothetical protein
MLRAQDVVQELVWLFVEVDDVRWEGATATTCLRASALVQQAQRCMRRESSMDESSWLFWILNLHESHSLECCVRGDQLFFPLRCYTRRMLRLPTIGVVCSR